MSDLIKRITELAHEEHGRKLLEAVLAEIDLAGSGRLEQALIDFHENRPDPDVAFLKYMDTAMEKATYEAMEDGEGVFGIIPGFDGCWGKGATQEECAAELLSTLEGWLLLGIERGATLPDLGIGCFDGWFSSERSKLASTKRKYTTLNPELVNGALANRVRETLKASPGMTGAEIRCALQGEFIMHTQFPYKYLHSWVKKGRARKENGKYYLIEEAAG